MPTSTLSVGLCPRSVSHPNGSLSLHVPSGKDGVSTPRKAGLAPHAPLEQS